MLHTQKQGERDKWKGSRDMVQMRPLLAFLVSLCVSPFHYIIVLFIFPLSADLSNRTSVPYCFSVSIGRSPVSCCLRKPLHRLQQQQQFAAAVVGTLRWWAMLMVSCTSLIFSLVSTGGSSGKETHRATAAAAAETDASSSRGWKEPIVAPCVALLSWGLRLFYLPHLILR